MDAKAHRSVGEDRHHGWLQSNRPFSLKTNHTPVQLHPRLQIVNLPHSPRSSLNQTPVLTPGNGNVLKYAALDLQRDASVRRVAVQQAGGHVLQSLCCGPSVTMRRSVRPADRTEGAMDGVRMVGAHVQCQR